MNRLPECVLFDLDGTILDSLRGIEASVSAAFASCDLPVPQTGIRDFIGPPIRTILARVGDVTDESVLDKLESAFRSHHDTEGWQKANCFPGAVQVLRALRQRGRRLFVISNKPRAISLKILDRENILELFEGIVTRDSRRPPFATKEEMILALLTNWSLAPDQCVVVGDTMEDGKAAAATGIMFIHMAHGYGKVESVHEAAIPGLTGFSEFLSLISEELVSGR